MIYRHFEVVMSVNTIWGYLQPRGLTGDKVGLLLILLWSVAYVHHGRKCRIPVSLIVHKDGMLFPLKLPDFWKKREEGTCYKHTEFQEPFVPTAALLSGEKSQTGEKEKKTNGNFW